MNKEWKEINSGHFILDKRDFYLSYNSNNINLDNAPELAIVKDMTFAIAYYTNPADYENIENYDDAIALMKSQIEDENTRVRIGFWNSYDFENGGNGFTNLIKKITKGAGND